VEYIRIDIVYLL